jgi:hypothetical protein
MDARQQGKYFWLVMESPPHPLMHFGMSGILPARKTRGNYLAPEILEVCARTERGAKGTGCIRGLSQAGEDTINRRKSGRHEDNYTSQRERAGSSD